MLEKHNKGKSYYLSTFWTIMIYSLFMMILLGISFLFFWILKALFINVFQIEQAIGDLISLIVSIIIFILPLIPQIKKFYIKMFNKLQQKAYILRRKRTITFDLKTTTEQAEFINKALLLLNNNESHLIALEGAPCKGKTTTAILLIDNIGKDTNLLELFVQLQRHIYYIDAGYEKKCLINYLNDNIAASRSLTIIDNVHKLSSNSLIMMLDKITAVTKYADSIGSKHLIILLYQDTNNNPTKQLLCEYFNEQSSNERGLFFKLNSALYHNSVEIKYNQAIDVDGIIFNKIIWECNELLQSHLLKLYVSINNDKLINIILTMLNNLNNKDCFIESELVRLITIIIVLSMYLGFVTQDAILKVWKNTSPQYKKRRCLSLIKYFSKSRFLCPFPFTKKTYLFNESLAFEYKKRFFSIEQFRNYYYECTNFLYKSNFFNAVELEWLTLISCKPCDILSVPESVKENLFYSAIEAMNKSYALTMLEEEIALDVQKKNIFHVELGILYIKTGQWALARQILKPYISNEKVSPKIVQLQLQIIEADHGVNDTENLDILNKINNMSNDTYIQFQTQYWIAHIKMEQGDFCLATWKGLQKKIEENSQWKNQHTYAHLIHRITADSCRTMFLKGDGNYNFFNKTLSFFDTYRVKPNVQEDLALEELENAHYIHYELVYQLGIWRMYQFQHDKTRSFDDSVSLHDLIDIALTLYDRSITQFLKAGNKTWRTAQIRRAELSFCSISPNFVELLSQLDNFEQYAHENNVDVFSGYIACLKGKAFALYALCVFLENEDTLYEIYLEKSIESFQRSIQIYNRYGNEFGALRSEMLHTIVNTIKNIDTTKEFRTVLDSFKSKLKEMQKLFNSDNIREQQVLKYLTDMPSLKIVDLINILKFYPIVLQ